MKHFTDTKAAHDFVQSADSRETDAAIMKAIVVHSDNINEAEYIWENGLDNFDQLSLNSFINTVTGDKGATDAADYCWGESTLAQAIKDTCFASQYEVELNE